MDLTTAYDTLSRTPIVMRALLTGASPAALAFREAADAWTAHEVLCHVTDGEETDWRPRVAAIMAGGERRFAPFDRLGGIGVTAGGRPMRCSTSSTGCAA